MNAMKQINNGFQNYYYLLQDGSSVYNEKTKHYIKPCHYMFDLKTIQGKRKRIALKTLYRIVFNKQFCLDEIKDLDGEVWKQIPNTEGCYFVSSKGRVKSYCDYNARILAPTYNRAGYARVDIWFFHGESRQAKLISRLVAESFLITPQHLSGYELHHKDFNKKNNSVDNLVWLTRKQHHQIHNKTTNDSKKKDSDKNAN